ncbi:MAG TPA: sigma-54 dependent transcriptional regulator [Chitinophagaceae bacterium]|nr:sigma-54 dependent transcriptional regulator [Chitinophagaceae bacterium]
MRNILVIDDDPDMGKLLSHFLTRKGFTVETASSGTNGLKKLREQQFSLVFSDFRLGDMDGIQVLKETKEINPACAVIIITGYSDIKMAVEVMRLGAFDYITKPLIPEEILNVINRVFETQPAGPTTKSDKQQEVAAGVENGFLVGRAPATVDMYRQIEIVAPTNFSVILYGESGTGKEVVAKTIHSKSDRSGRPFVAVDCGTLSRELAASELFGHIKGSFTGAIGDKEGFFEAANGGTLFLDEVGNLPLDVQVTLLRVIQEKKFRRVGSNKDQFTDVRVIVASNENLKEAYKKGKFREDLYHRFNEFSINIPPLRKRKEDIPLLANFFLASVAGELGKTIDGFDNETMELFLNYDWPGNIRELKNVIRRSTLLTSSGKITSNVLPWEILGSLDEPGNVANETAASPVAERINGHGIAAEGLKDATLRAEYNKIMEVLKQVNYNKTKAAIVLNIDRKTLYNKIKQYEDLQEAE